MLRLSADTGPAWFAAVERDFGTFLQDHAACERKALATAMALVAHYPDRALLVDAMIVLATEELDHFVRVRELLTARGIPLAVDKKSLYAAGLRRQLRELSGARLTDRLLVAAIIEARSCERLGIVARNLPDGPERDFYRELAVCEARHHADFVRLAKTYADPDDVDARLDELLGVEAALLTAQPVSAHVHGGGLVPQGEENSDSSVASTTAGTERHGGD
ncbi:MAG: tRNA-(ms[2]io[6]A)-hydroxylase [Planctomycetes bacterium]|nr:tRNA-(ms[2]io[6]A)-hydroxylase [Planctomycetota bacterium]